MPGVFNWSDDAQPMVAPPGIDVPSSGTDVWTGAKVLVNESTIMPLHSAYLLRELSMQA